ncbi:MAG: hypothetical protein R2875_12360 [Desulfobacterales bacterium]
MEKMTLDQLYTGAPTPGAEAAVRGLAKALVAYEVLVLNTYTDTGTGQSDRLFHSGIPFMY